MVNTRYNERYVRDEDAYLDLEGKVARKQVLDNEIENNPNPYILGARVATIKELRQEDDNTKIGLELPKVAKKEICDDSKESPFFYGTPISNSDIRKNTIEMGYVGYQRYLYDDYYLTETNYTPVDATGKAILKASTTPYANLSPARKDVFGALDSDFPTTTLPLKPSQERNRLNNVKEQINTLYLPRVLEKNGEGDFYKSATDTLLGERLKGDTSLGKRIGLDDTGKKTLNMNSLCGQSLDDTIKGQEAQLLFIALARGGYAGPNTSIELNKKENTSEGVKKALKDKTEKAKKETIAEAKERLKNNDGISDLKVCVRYVNGIPQEVDYDPTRPNEKQCDK